MRALMSALGCLKVADGDHAGRVVGGGVDAPAGAEPLERARHARAGAAHRVPSAQGGHVGQGADHPVLIGVHNGR